MMKQRMNPQSSTGDEDQEDVEGYLECAGCALPLKSTVHIKCGECDARMCLKCTQMGVEAGYGKQRHLRGHNYEVVDITKKDVLGCWGHRAEAQLIEAACRYKMGNWGEIVNMMRGDHTPESAAEYFDKYFIRGAIGQFGLKAMKWFRERTKLVRSEEIKEIIEDDHNFLKYHIMMDALRWKEDVSLDPDAVALEDKVDDILREYVQYLIDVERIEDESRVSFNESFAINDVVSDADSLDPSSDDDRGKDGEKKAKFFISRSPMLRSLRQYSEEPSEPKPKVGILIRKYLNGHGKYKVEPVFETPKEKLNRSCKVTSHSSTKSKLRNTGSSTKKVKVSISSDEEDDEKEDEIPSSVHMNGNGISHTEYGMEESGSDSYESARSSQESETPKQSLTPSSSFSSIKRRKKTKTKKQRRLESFEKRMALKIKKREQMLDEVEEICPKSMIQELRASSPRLAMDRERVIGAERPKFRNDDLAMVGFNYDRDEFDMESFNDAETLISKQNIRPPSGYDKISRVEMDIHFARIQRYCRILARRNARRRAIMEHDKITQFIDFMKMMTVEKRTATEILEERSPMEKLLSRCQQTLTKDELNKLTSHMERAEELRGRIEKLRSLQKKGITSLKGYEKEINTPAKKLLKKKGPKMSEKKKADNRWRSIQRWHRLANGE